MKTIRLLTYFAFLLFIHVGFISCSSDSTSSEPKEDPLASVNELTSFALVGNNVAEVSIEEAVKTIHLRFPFLWNDFDNITIQFTISSRASANLVSGNTYDFRSPQTLIITSVTGLQNIYTIAAECCSGTAVIISDTQNDNLPLHNQELFFTNINKVIDKAHDAGVPTYYSMFSNSRLIKNTTAWKLPAQLHVYDEGILFDKVTISDAFDSSTKLHKRLMQRGIGKIIMVGVSSTGCVLFTGRGAASLKYDITLIGDAHSEPRSSSIESVERGNTMFAIENLGRIIKADELTFD